MSRATFALSPLEDVSKTSRLVKAALDATKRRNVTQTLAQQLEGVSGFMCGGMCHVYFMSTAMDIWSGVKGHTAIFQHPGQLFVSRSNVDSLSVCLRLF